MTAFQYNSEEVKVPKLLDSNVDVFRAREQALRDAAREQSIAFQMVMLNDLFPEGYAPAPIVIKPWYKRPKYHVRQMYRKLKSKWQLHIYWGEKRYVSDY